MPRPLEVDLLTLKVVSESLVTWTTSMPILVFLGLSVLDLGPMYVRDRQISRQTDVRRASSLMPPLWGRGIIMVHCQLCIGRSTRDGLGGPFLLQSNSFEVV